MTRNAKIEWVITEGPITAFYLCVFLVFFEAYSSQGSTFLSSIRLSLTFMAKSTSSWNLLLHMVTAMKSWLLFLQKSPSQTVEATVVTHAAVATLGPGVAYEFGKKSWAYLCLFTAASSLPTKCPGTMNDQIAEVGEQAADLDPDDGDWSDDKMNITLIVIDIAYLSFFLYKNS